MVNKQLTVYIQRAFHGQRAFHFIKKPLSSHVFLTCTFRNAYVLKGLILRTQNAFFEQNILRMSFAWISLLSCSNIALLQCESKKTWNNSPDSFMCNTRNLFEKYFTKRAHLRIRPVETFKYYTNTN